MMKMEFNVLKWFSENKRVSEYKKRVLLSHALISVQNTNEIPLWFIDEFFQLLIWNGKHLGCLYPYSRSFVSSVVNEGMMGTQLAAYSISNKASFNLNGELLLSYFFMAFGQKNKERRYFTIKKFLDAILNNYNQVLLERDIFWHISRIKLLQFQNESLESFLGPNLSDFCVQLLLYKLVNEKEEKGRRSVVDILYSDFDSEESSGFIFKRLLSHLIDNCILEDGEKSLNLLHNLSNMILKRKQIVSPSVEIDSLLLELITTLTFKNNVEIRQKMKDVKLFKIRDLLLIEMVRSSENEDALMKMLTKFSFDAICNLKNFRDDKALTNLLRTVMRSENEDLQVKFFEQDFDRQIIQVRAGERGIAEGDRQAG
jgi:hypothetical protein